MPESTKPAPANLLTESLIVKTMASVNLFQHLPRDTIVRLLRAAGKSIFKTGDVVFEEGGEGQCLYIVVAGSFEVFRTAGGRKVHLADIQPGEHFGEISLLTQRPRTASVRAIDNAIAIRLTRDAVMAESGAALQLFQNMASMLAAHLVDANEEIICHTVQRQATSANALETQADQATAPSAPIMINRGST
jgi:CRP-like cAMP-binding protein